MPELDRRTALPLIITGLAAAGLIVATVGSEQAAPSRLPVKEAPSPILPTKSVSANILEWPEYLVPAVDGSFRVDQAALRLLPDNIGLSELFIGTSRAIDLINVYTVWDPSKVKTGLTSRFQINGLAGFQEISEPFQGDIRVAVGNRSSRVTLKEAQTFAGSSISSIITKYQDNIQDSSSNNNSDIFPRPISDKPMALVFGPGYVEYKNALSPLRYLGVRFRFDPQTRSVI